MLIFEKSRPGCHSTHQAPQPCKVTDIPAQFLREDKAVLPEVSELEVVRHYTLLSQQNFSVDTNFYPLGSCTMKYNPRCLHTLASLPGFLGLHPDLPAAKTQGLLTCLYELQNDLTEITGMVDTSLAGMAGASGEFAGVAMIKAYHDERGDTERCELIVPDAAHGTNPASATMCGYKVREIPTLKDGDVDIEALKAALGPQTAGIMLTNPSTLGVFERKITKIADLVHEAGGLLYYDGANLNAIMGRARPGDMGFDVLHLNLHKTFGTPHGGGGPGVGAVAANKTLAPYLPTPMAGLDANGNYFWKTKTDMPKTIGNLSAFAGNVGVMLRAYIYIKVLGREGLRRVADFATLNANYLMARMRDAGFTLAYPMRRAVHEFIVTVEPEHKEYGVTAFDFAKCLLDQNVHAPTMYFPLLVPECFLIEPTETECKREMDHFVDTMVKIRDLAKTDPDALHNAPMHRPVRRLDDVKAARELDAKYSC